MRMARSNGIADAAGSLLFAQGLVKVNRREEALSVLKLVVERGSDEDKAKANDMLRRIQ
jgi:Tfp pilus assembly protein FimV